MNTKRMTGVAILIVAGWAAGSAPAQTTNPAGVGDWISLIREAEGDGVPAAWTESFQKRCMASAITVLQAAPILAPVRQAARQGLPQKPIQDKVDEGLAKNVKPEALASAAQTRLERTGQAAALASRAGYTKDSEGCNRVTLATALALDAGLSKAELKPILDRGGGRRAGIIESVLGTGEALVRAGYRIEAAQAVMRDCLDHDLRRSEILRLIRVIEQNSHPTSSIPELRRALWGDTDVNAGAKVD